MLSAIVILKATGRPAGQFFELANKAPFNRRTRVTTTPPTRPATSLAASSTPGCPFAVAATGPRGMRLAARYGQAWVTTGDPKPQRTGTPEQSAQALGGQVEKLADAAAAIGRDTTRISKILLTGFTPERGRPLESLDAFVDFSGRHPELGFTDLVVHWPLPDSDCAADEKLFERIAMDAPDRLS